MSVAPVISFENVSKSYGGAAPVLDRVSLDVREREFLAIVGPSGSGKTTLLRLVNRLIDPSAGTVRVEGQDVQSVDAVTGAPGWTWDSETKAALTTPVWTDAGLLVGSTAGGLYLISPGDGTERWRLDTGYLLSGVSAAPAEANWILSWFAFT